MTDYNLTFFCKETKQEFKGKRNIGARYLLINLATNEKLDLSIYTLRKLFHSGSGNKKAAVKRTPWQKQTVGRPGFKYSKAYREYLENGVSA